MSNSTIRRRTLLQRSAALALAGSSGLGWLSTLAEANDTNNGGARQNCIVLWMGGAPSQLDTFDMKPGHKNGGEFSEIDTNVPGVRFSEHLPRLAQHADKLSIVRTLNSKEGDHERAASLVKTGVVPGGPMPRPHVCAALAHELCGDDDTLPPLVRVSSNGFVVGRPIGPAYLGPRFLPLNVGVASESSLASPTGRNGQNATINEGAITSLTVDSLNRPAAITSEREARRAKMWATLEGQFLASHPASSIRSHRSVYENARQLMTSKQADAFDLSLEDESLRRRYGVGSFGQGCLLARRLVEQGVSFVEVVLDRSTLSGSSWDTHSNNFPAVQSLSAELDAGWSTLLEDLDQRGLLETTTVVWMGEFGRTPQINGTAGRDHFPRAFSAVLCGGKTKTGQVYGQTSIDGMSIQDNPVSVPQFLATICEATGVSPDTMIKNETGRPVPIVDASPIGDLIA